MNGTQLQALWVAQGGDPAVAPTMAAIALAESSGNPNALCYDYPDPATGKTLCSSTPRSDAFQVDCGLWQIANGNIGASIEDAPAILSNPQTNAQAAVKVLGSQGLGAWSSYTKGTYLAQTGAAGSSASGKSILTQIVQSSDNPFVLLQNWIASPTVDVMYKAFVGIFVLMLLGAIPNTSRFALWVALALLVLLMIQPNTSAAGSTVAANVVGGGAAPL